MKRTVPIYIAATLLAVAASILTGLLSPYAETAPDASFRAEDSAPPDGYETPRPAPSAPPDGWSDGSFTLRLSEDGEVREISMSEYLAGTVAAEMPPGFEPDALAAQAVAARTYAVYSSRHRSSAHPDADVCSDSAHCAAYKTEAQLREKWGADYGAYISKITAAVRETDGVYLKYDGEPILAAFHASSSVQTEASENVWGKAYPYLVSVETPETAETVPSLIETVVISKSDFKETITKAYPDAKLGADASLWFGAAEPTAAGRVASVEIGGVTVPGAELRRLFGLRSTRFAAEVGDDVVITTAGYGHGVGMSQQGANLLAKLGYGWREILETYYPGTEPSG